MTAQQPQRIAVKNSLTGKVEIFPMTDHERLPLEFDFSPVLEDGETVASVTVTLIDRRTDDAYPEGLHGTVALATPLATQAVTNLAPGGRYRLKMLAAVGAVKLWEPFLDIDCID